MCKYPKIKVKLSNSNGVIDVADIYKMTMRVCSAMGKDSNARADREEMRSRIYKADSNKDRINIFAEYVSIR
jgi:hypothetical protein